MLTLGAFAAGAPVWVWGGLGFAATLVALVVVARATVPRVEQAAPQTSPIKAGFGRTILERVPAALMIITSKGRVEYANTAALQLLPQILVGRHFGTVFRSPVFVDAVNQALLDGVLRHVEFSIPLQDHILEAQVVRLPVTEHEEDDRQVIVAIADRTEEHRNAQMRTDFIANASHELRTPLASLIGYIETLREYGHDDPEAQRRFLAIMDKQAQRMRRLVDDLMSLSRIEMNVHIKPDESADLHHIVAQAAAELGLVADKAGVTVNVDLPLPGPQIICDRDQMMQVATNLIDNAIKYGNTQVGITPAENISGNSVGVTVTDDGDGIPKKDIHRLTERFFRVNAAKSKEIGGTGLGLAIVKHILNRHDGRLDITSNAGEGSTFTFWMPHAPGIGIDATQLAQTQPVDAKRTA